MQIHLLHNHRDGRGKVCQRRLWVFPNSRQLEQVCWEEIREAVEGRWPDVRGDWERVAEQASQLSMPRTPDTGADKLKAACRRLRLWIAREPEVARKAGAELATLLASLQKLELPEKPCPRQLARLKQQEGQLEEAARILAELVRSDPTPENRVELATVLLKAGRPEEALEHFRSPLSSDAFRHYNEALALLAIGRLQEALYASLRGMARDRRVTNWLLKPGGNRGAAYWKRFGSLWDEPKRSFLRAVAGDRVVRLTLSIIDPGKLPGKRILLPQPMMETLLRRVQAVQEEDLAGRAKSAAPCN